MFNKNLWKDKFRRNLGLIICLTAFIIYFNTLRHNYALDDYSVISDNTVTVQGVKAIPEIFSNFYRYGYYFTDDGIYRPLSVAMFAVEWAISPNNPWLGHFVNVFFYMLTGWVMFITLIRLLKNYNSVFPFVITLLFITHPIHTEVVANIKSRDELMAFLFSLFTLHYLLDYTEFRSEKKIAVAGIFFLAALLSKETAITMVLGIPLMLYFFTDTKRKSLIVSLLCLSGVAIIFLLIRWGVLDGSKPNVITTVENSLLITSSKADRIATAIKILGDYLALLVYPKNLLYDRSYNHIPIVGFSNIQVLLTLTIYTLMIIYAVWGFFKKKLLAFSILFYLITISLFSNIIFIIGVAMADRFTYFASFGFCFGLTVILIRLLKSPTAPVKFSGLSDFYAKNKPVLLIALTVSLLYSIRTIYRNANWKDNYTLFKHDVKLAPENARTHSFLGNELIKTVAQQEPDVSIRVALYQEGINELKYSLKIYPEHADALNSIGAGYFQLDSMDLAEYYFKKALAINPTDFSQLADFYMAKKEYNNAILSYKKMIALHPNNSDAHINLGICFGTLTQYKEAIHHFKTAAELQPKNPQIYRFLSTAYKFDKDEANAEKYYQLAHSIDPNIARP